MPVLPGFPLPFLRRERSRSIERSRAAENSDQCVSEFVGFADQVDGEVEDDFEGFVFVEAVFGDEPAEEGAVDSAGYIVAGGDGEEGTGVVVEAYCVVEAGG